jgi:HAD superfamily hydrolase (TIGR01549 family)
MQGIKAIVFDVFGTLVEITEKRRPFVQLMNLIHAAGRQPVASDATTIMSNNIGLAGVAQLFGGDICPATIAKLELELAAELSTIRLYPEVRRTLVTLRSAGLKIGICSNLAAPYSVPVKALLPFELDAYAWSYEVGAVKPEVRIYQAICDALNCSPHEVIMVGDTLEADYAGPNAFGMNAYYLTRKEKTFASDQLNSIDEILSKICL